MKKTYIPAHVPDDPFPLLLTLVKDAFEAASGPLFETNATHLYDAFLSWLPAEIVQTYRCHACRHFVEKYGGLVTVDENGKQRPVMWPAATAATLISPFAQAIEGVRRIVAKSEVQGVFLSKEKVWGTPTTGHWHHLNIVPPPSLVYRGLDTASQQAAAKREDFLVLSRAVLHYDIDTAGKTLGLLRSGHVPGAEKVLGQAKWFFELQKRRQKTSRALRPNLLWHAVATAPPGWPKIPSSVLATMMDDMKAGRGAAALVRSFAEKTRGTNYQRPKAAPTAGNVATAEKLVERLAATGALARRFAMLNEIEVVWAQTSRVRATSAGIFSDLIDKPKSPRLGDQDFPPIKITWQKFRASVLPTALAVQCLVPYRGQFAAIVGPTDPSAPPILQWDREDRRNPFSGYVYSSPSPADQWALIPSTWVRVNAFSLNPHQWYGGDYPQHGVAAIAILDGCRDRGNAGLGLFPSILKSEFHGIRSTIEAYSNQHRLTGGAEASACGIMVFGVTFRVTTRTHTARFVIDRWD